MSNPVSALKGRVVSGGVTITDAGLQGMIAVRCDLSLKPLRAVLAKVSGAEMPATGKVSTNGANAICWMSPDEVLVLVPYDTVQAAIETIGSALLGQHALATNVSDARGLINVSGPYAREVIAKLAPVDMHGESFAVGDFRRSRLGQVAAAFWMAEDDMFRVICFRSVADYTFDLLAASAAAGPVGFLKPA